MRSATWSVSRKSVTVKRWCLAGLHRIGRLAPLEAGIDRYDNATGYVNTEHCRCPLPTVRCPHRNPVAGLDPRRHRRGGKAMDLGSELGEGPADPAVGDRFNPAKRSAASSMSWGMVDRNGQSLAHRGPGKSSTACGSSIRRQCGRVRGCANRRGRSSRRCRLRSARL